MPIMNANQGKQVQTAPSSKPKGKSGKVGKVKKPKK